MPARHRDPALAACKSVKSLEPGILKFEWDIVLLHALAARAADSLLAAIPNPGA